MNEEIKLLAFFGHHKGATTWIGNIINQICQSSGLKCIRANSPKWFKFNLQNYIDENKADFLNYINADITYVNQLQSFKGFHVIRDPRDIAVSAYFSHLHTHPTEVWPELLEHRKKLVDIPKDEGLLLDIEFSNRLRLDGHNLNLFSSMKNWDYSNPHIMEVKFEDIIQNSHELFSKVFDFLGLLNKPPVGCLQQKIVTGNISREILFQNIESNNFLNLTNGRNTGEENRNSHYRKGVVGDWKNHFNEKHKNYFKNNYNGLLVKLGYELDDKW